jgi:hypothetical protein
MPEGAGDHSQARQPNENSEYDVLSCPKQSLPRSGAPHRQHPEEKPKHQTSRNEARAREKPARNAACLKTAPNEARADSPGPASAMKPAPPER